MVVGILVYLLLMFLAFLDQPIDALLGILAGLLVFFGAPSPTRA